jgi:hypothetical protein
MDFPGKTSQSQSQSPPKSGSVGNTSKNGQSGFRFDYDSAELPTENFAVNEPGIAPGASPAPFQNEGGLSPKALWLRRLTLALFVVVCVEVGLVLIVFPWTHVWTDNALLIRNVTLRSLAMHNFVRGLVTGLGLINVWMGIWEAVHYREAKPEMN